MLGRNSGTTVKNVTTIGEAITNGAGYYANHIQNARDSMEREYGNTISRAVLATADLGKDALGACDGTTVYMSKRYVSNVKGMTDAMKIAEEQGFHPKLNGKSGAEAVTAHELGHYLVEQTKTSARTIVYNAGKSIGVKGNKMASGISGYARYNYDETIAEAVADVYCNGSKASRNSIAITKEIKRLLK